METNEKKQTNNTPQKNEMKISFTDGNKTLSWLEKMLTLINTFGVKKLMQACFFFVTFFLMNILFNALQNDKIVDKFISSITKTHIENADVRTYITPQVNNCLLRLLHNSKADRTFILEMHNGKENPTSLPFLYCDMTYEETNELKNIPYISHEYENMNMSKFNMFTYLYRNRFFIGTINDLKEIDRRLANRLEDNGAKYIAVILIKSNIEIGFLGVSYSDTTKLSKDEIHAKLGDCVQEVSNLLDLSKQKLKMVKKLK